MPKRKVTVNVTANDIKYGKRGDGFSCPIHRSLNRHKVVREQGKFNVSRDAVFHVRDNGIVNVEPPYSLGRLPADASTFIWRFDRGFNVKPFTFEMEIEVPENAS